MEEAVNYAECFGFIGFSNPAKTPQFVKIDQKLININRETLKDMK